MKLKKPLAAAALTLLLAGCIPAPSPNYDFPTLKASPEPRLAGDWTAGTGSWMLSFKIKEDGNGYSCWSTGGTQRVNRLKYDGAFIQLQDGTKYKVKDLKDNAFNASTDMTLGASYIMHKDPSFKNADPQCTVALSKFD